MPGRQGTAIFCQVAIAIAAAGCGEVDGRVVTETTAANGSWFATVENRGRWVTLMHAGESLDVFVPNGFEEKVATEDTVLLETGGRRVGVGHFYTSSRVLLYVGAFVLPEDDEVVSADDLVIFENALRDGATVAHVRRTDMRDRFLLHFPNGDDLVADVRVIRKASVMFVAKSIRDQENEDWQRLDMFLDSLE
jgi:hypothetical protein